jgi:aspartate kinase
MLTADPRIVKNPQVVPHLSFAEASELAYFGAKVLHPSTIQPAVSRNIPVRILNSHRAQARGTLITGERPKADRPLTAVASKKGVTVVNITSTRMLMAHGFLRRLFEVFERFKTPVDVVTTSEITVSVTIDDARRLPAIVEALSEFAQVDREENMAIVCVVGDGLHEDAALAAQVLASVGDVPMRMLSQAASRRNITFVIREPDLPTALGRVHDTFFAQPTLAAQASAGQAVNS